jgi:S1-C subfamily serine protease
MYTLDQLRGAVRALKPGSAVTLQIQREGRLQYISFTLD